MTHSIYLNTINGQRLALIENWQSLTYQRMVNASSNATIVVPADNIDLRNVSRDTVIDIYRLAGNTERLATDTRWLVRSIKKWRDAKRVSYVELGCKSVNSILNRRNVAANAGTANARKTAAADDMLRAIAREQLGASASSDRSWASLITIGADLGLAPSQTKEFAWRKVEKTMQEIALASMAAGTGLYFDVIWNGQSYEFIVAIGQRGTDRSRSGFVPAEVSEERGNLSEPTLIIDYEDEVTAVTAIGAGVGNLRLTTVATDTTRINASPFGRIESVINANADSSSLLTAEANAALRDGRPKRLFTGKLLDTSSFAYERDWFWGDKITATYDGQTFDCSIDAIQVSVSGNKETIAAGLRAEDIL